MEIKQTIDVQEIDGKDVPVMARVTIGIDSHWNYKSLVVLVVGEKKYTVDAGQLDKAIENATNH